ncbi:MAG: hypothetical protein V4725_15890 [Bacteroidota bacterium]
MINYVEKYYPFSVKLFACLCALSLSGVGMAQTADAFLRAKFNEYQQQGVQEKMFLHTDKEFYVAGEICWFKIYSVDAKFHKPLNLSKVAYIELLDNNNKVVLQSKVEMDSSTGHGSLYVPVTINSGSYKLRAYSNWMKNFDASLFFEKTLTIVNTQKATQQTAAVAATSYDVRFFPEGGNLVAGLQSKVAFSVKDRFGSSVDSKLFILAGNKDTVATASSQKFGMGSFVFTPKNEQRYTAVVQLGNGVVVTRELPAAYKTGYVMQLTDADERRLKVEVSSANVGADGDLLYLFIQTRGTVKAIQGGSLQNGKAVFMIDKLKPAAGISQFTVFNADKKPLCERLYFKYPLPGLDISLKPDEPVYTTRQKINLSVSAFTPNKQPAMADMSMTVFRLDSLQQPAQSTIHEYLWLIGELPGFVESPSYYFTAASSASDIDHLMLVNGWRRFRWEEIVKNEKPLFKFAPEQKGMLVTGKIVNSKTGQAAPNVRGYLSVPGSNPLFRTSLSDEKGMVKFEMNKMLGTPGIIVQGAPDDSNTYRVEINNAYSDDFADRIIPIYAVPFKYQQTLAAHNLSAQVENVYNGPMRMKVQEREIDTTKFYHHPNEIYFLDSYTRFTTVEEVLREYVYSVGVRRRNGKFFLLVYNDADKYNGMFDKQPLILLDGVPLFDVEKFMRYDPLKIRRLETVTRRYFYGNTAFDGIINMFTYNGDLQGYELDPETTVIDYEGLQLQREFYAPGYETNLKAASRIPDFRNVLSWMPNIKTGKDGQYQAGFYSSDLPGKYMVEVQGITPNGEPGVGRTFFEVRKPVK